MSRQRDGRSTHTQQRILKEAEALYLAGGYENINQQEIANHLHITKAALFYHFASKQELFFRLVLFILERTHQVVTSAVADEPSSTQEKLQRLMLALLEQPTFDVTRFSHEEIHLLTEEQQHEISEAMNQRMMAIVQNVFADGIARGELRPHDVQLSTLLFLQICIPLSHPKSPLRGTMSRQQREYATLTLDDEAIAANQAYMAVLPNWALQQFPFSEGVSVDEMQSKREQFAVFLLSK